MRVWALCAVMVVLYSSSVRYVRRHRQRHSRGYQCTVAPFNIDDAAATELFEAWASH